MAAFVTGLSDTRVGYARSCGERRGIAKARICTVQRRQQRCAAAPRALIVAMAGDDGQGPTKSSDAGEEEKPQTLKGIVVFGLTMALFALGLAATLGRAFLPGGLAPPPNM
eukprot:CAMPEP_0185830670 /NCGR_PEP_ID=MMETSP1353-20130828/1010_1 /TAXON_ID=1077150 /ORGANISM="Erythrolobus australicus, Strain CCMP3124" /LENGTH=110 /DNA_ID=CAMNT_0028528635 /DNA_START=21 /DNA_END=353 /DNA_ORIENTATION=-